MTIDARALKCLQNVDLIKKLFYKKFVDLDLDIDFNNGIDKSRYLHISMNIDARSLKFSQCVNLMYT